MITTQYGSQMTIIKRTGDGWALVRRESDQVEREWHVSQLRGETKEDFAQLHYIEYGNVTA